MHVVICYDISSNRNRTRLYELLLGHGTPVQRSVFECDLSDKQLAALRRRARPFASSRGDSIRYYQMCADCCVRTQSDGTPLIMEDSDGDYLV